MSCTERVWQITVAVITGSKAEEFRQKVGQASTGHPWYTYEPRVVCMCCHQSIGRSNSSYLLLQWRRYVVKYGVRVSQGSSHQTVSVVSKN